MKRFREWNILFVLLLSLLSFGCSSDPDINEDPVGPDIPEKERTFKASLENVESRVYVEDGHSARWTKDDKISLFDSNTQNSLYLFAGNTGDSSGTFKAHSKPAGSGTSLNTNYAVYPYDSNVGISENGVITLTLPSKQHYAENSFGLGDNTLVAVTSKSDDTDLKFKNVCGYYKILLYDEDLTVKSITLTGNNGEKIAGKAQVTAEYNKLPVVTMANDASTSITLDCGANGVKVGSTWEEATTFWMAVPPTVFEKGVTLTITDIKGNETIQTTEDQVVIERNMANRTTLFKDNQYAVFYDENGWDESVYFGNGSQIHMNKDEEAGYVKNMFAWAVDSKNGLHPVVSEMDEQGMPTKIIYGNTEIFVTRYDEATLDMTLFVDNEFVLQVDGITHGLTLNQASRAWADNNAVRNTVALLQLVAATIEIVASGSGIVAGVASGQIWAVGISSVTLVSGIADFKEAYDKIFSEPQPANDDFSFVLKNYSDSSIDVGKELQSTESNFYKMLYENKSLKDLNLKLSDFKGIASLALSLIDKLWGESYNSAEQIEAFKNSVFVSVPMPEEVSSSSARLSATYLYFDNGGVSNINMKPGMRYHKTDEPSAFKDSWNPYDHDETNYYFYLENLEADTEYTCRAVYHETEHDWYFFSDKTTFTTKKHEAEELREALVKLYESTGGDNWTNNENWCSDKPVDEWYGVAKREDGTYELLLRANNLTGKIDQTFPKKIYGLELNENMITSIIIAGSLSTLDVSGCTKLWNLNCSNNQLSTLDVSGCTKLSQIHCEDNQLTSLDLSGTALSILYCHDNQLTSLNVSGCTALRYLACYGNQLSSLDLSGFTTLGTLYCYNNQLTSLDVSGCTALTDLYCWKNQLTSLDVSGFKALTNLSCEENRLTSLNVSGCTALTSLSCYLNRLSSLNVSGFTALIDLSCTGNQLSSLNVSGCTALTYLSCAENQLTSLDLSGCRSLESVQCGANKINSEIPTWFSQLHTFTYDVKYTYTHDENGYKVCITNPYGWWYPGEPEKGEHRPD